MTTTMHAAFLDDIIAHPKDDTPRLIYADWLQDHGEERRAEFIRVQCEIARREWLVNPHEGHACALNPCPLCKDVADRERLWKYERHWIEENRSSIQGQLRPLTMGLLRQYEPGQFDPEGNILFSRGFIHTVRCPLAAWLKHGPEIAAQHPLEVVRLTDREPMPMPNGDGGYMWYRLLEGEGRGQAYDLPRESFPRGKDGVRSIVLYFPTLEAAHAWASERAILWARGKLLSKEQQHG